MVRTFSWMALLPAMIAVTPATAQVVDMGPTAAEANAAAVANAAADDTDTPKPRTVRIAGRTVDVDSLPAADDAKPAALPTKQKVRARR